MLVDLLGLLDDGSNRSPRVPATAKSSLEVPLGVTATIRLTAKTVANIPIDLTTGTVKLTVKRSFTDSTPLFTLTGSRPAGSPSNVVTFTLPSTTTKPLSPGRYVYDVWTTATVSGSRDQLVPLSLFALLPVVALP